MLIILRDAVYFLSSLDGCFSTRANCGNDTGCIIFGIGVVTNRNMILNTVHLIIAIVRNFQWVKFCYSPIGHTARCSDFRCAHKSIVARNKFGYNCSFPKRAFLGIAMYKYNITNFDFIDSYFAVEQFC